MIRVSPYVVVAVLLSCQECKASLAILAEQPPILWSPADDSGEPSHTIQVINTDDTEPINVVIWGIDLQIVKDNSAVGNLAFKNIHTPPNYLFPDNPTPTTHPVLPLSGVKDLFVSAIELSFQGVPILAGEQFDMANLEFDTSEAVSGTFHLIALPPSDLEEGSLWKNDPFSQDNITFENLPVSGDPITIVSITVVPEPNSLILFLCGSCLACCVWRTRVRFTDAI